MAYRDKANGVNVDPAAFWGHIGKNQGARSSFLQRPTEDAYWASGQQNAKYLLRRMPSPKVAVEYGSGDGRIARFMAPRCERFVCVDIARSVLDLAQAQLTKAGILNVEYRLAGEFAETDFADLVYCFQVVQHNPVAEQFRIFARIHSYLRPGGVACIHLAAAESIPGYQNISTCMRFTRSEAEELATSVDWRFTIERRPLAPDIPFDHLVWAQK